MPHYPIDVTKEDTGFILVTETNEWNKHPKCLGFYDAWTGDFDCDYYTTISCEECKYGIGRKDPEAKCNQIK